MDFERAAERLASDQRKSRASLRSRPVGLAVSAKAKREAEERRRRTAQRLAEQRRQRSRLTYGVRYMDRCDGWLGVDRLLGRAGDGGADGAPSAVAVTGARPSQGAAAAVGARSSNPTWASNHSLLLRPVSIHGDGDKLSLPPSVLASLAASGLVGGGSDGASQQQPLAFRVGILNGDYVFPSSEALRGVMERAPIDADSGEAVDEANIDSSDDNDSGSDMEELEANEDGRRGTVNTATSRNKKKRKDSQDTKAYLEELSHRYMSYTHATVVEFTMNEGEVGLPQSVASALLGDTVSDGDPTTSTPFQTSSAAGNTVTVPRKRTVDPASAATMATSDGNDGGHENDETKDNNDGDGHDSSAVSSMHVDDQGEKTPGHLAWGAFDIPDSDVEITLIKLPKGKACTLVPTHEAVRNGFYNLKDVKLVLEQSLIRTRATLSINDVVHTWHRGVKFDLVVKDVTPDAFGAVSCINTDIEVELATPEGFEDTTKEPNAAENGIGKNDTALASFASGTGYKLSDGPRKTPKSEIGANVTSAAPVVELPSEPPKDQKSNVCEVQVRGDGATGRRRFDITKASIKDLFVFASISCNMNDTEGETFRLVTRFPRRVFSVEKGAQEDGDQKLVDAGIGEGREMFLIERL